MRRAYNEVICNGCGKTEKMPHASKLPPSWWEVKETRGRGRTRGRSADLCPSCGEKTYSH